MSYSVKIAHAPNPSYLRPEEEEWQIQGLPEFVKVFSKFS